MRRENNLSNARRRTSSSDFSQISLTQVKPRSRNSATLVSLSGSGSVFLTLDSAGIGELVLVYTRAQEKNASLKFAGANSLVRTLLDLTNLDQVLDVQPSIEAALEAFREEAVCADC